MIDGVITNMSQQGLQLTTEEALMSGKIYNLRISSTRTPGRELFLKIRLVY